MIIGYPKNSATLQKKLRLFYPKGKLCGCLVFYPSINLLSKRFLIQILQIFKSRVWNSSWRIKSNFSTKMALLKSRFRWSVIKNLLSFSDFKQRHVWLTEWLIRGRVYSRICTKTVNRDSVWKLTCINISICNLSYRRVVPSMSCFMFESVWPSRVRPTFIVFTCLFVCFPGVTAHCGYIFTAR
jgi:hypothetical protein